jgi:hypothetical protein
MNVSLNVLIEVRQKMVNGLTNVVKFQPVTGIIDRRMDFSKTNLSASGTLTLVKDLFSSLNADAVQIDEVHIFVKTALNGSTGSNIDITGRYSVNPDTASDVTIFTSAGAIACDAAANVRQVFSKTTGTKAINGTHPEDGSLSAATLDQAYTHRINGERWQLRLGNPGAAAITSGVLLVQLRFSIGSILK